MAMMDIPANSSLYLALAPLAGWPDTAARKRQPGPVGRLLTRYLVWRARRETIRMLSAVDGATLRDLGINDIESQVYGAPEERRRPYDPYWWRKR